MGPRSWKSSTRIISCFAAVLWGAEIHSWGDRNRLGQSADPIPSLLSALKFSVINYSNGLYCSGNQRQQKHPFCWVLYIHTLRNNLCTRCPYHFISLCCFFFPFLEDYLVYGCSFENCYLVEQFRLSTTQRQPLFFITQSSKVCYKCK